MRRGSSLEWVPWGSLLFLSLAQAKSHIKVIAQEQRLWVADPKAVHYILQGSHDTYDKLPIMKEMFATLMGSRPGDGRAERKFFCHTSRDIITKSELGDEHKRQRRAVSPAFGSGTKALHPYFSRCCNTVSHRVSTRSVISGLNAHHHIARR